MLGEFFGLTGVSAVMLDINGAYFSKLCTLLNNRLDVFRLTKFKVELEYLKYFLQERVQVEYNSPDIKKMLRQAKLVRDGAEEQLKRSFKVDISGMDAQQREEFARSIEKNSIDLANSLNVPETIVNSFKLYNKEEKVSLGEHELLVLKNFKQNLYSTINQYHRNSVTGNFEQITIFGKKLHEIATKSPRYLMGVVEGLFNQPGVDTSLLAKQCLEWVNIFRTYFVREEVSDTRYDAEGLMDHFIQALDFRARLLSLEGLDPVISDESLLSPERRELLELFNRESSDFYNVMKSIISGGLVDKFAITVITDMYINAFRMDNDMPYLCELLFSEEDNVILTREEIVSVYNNLNNIGFYCFNLQNSRLMVESLKKLSFSFKAKTVINPDQVVGGYSFSRVLEDIEYLCYSLRPMGSRLEEVI